MILIRCSPLHFLIPAIVAFHCGKADPTVLRSHTRPAIAVPLCSVVDNPSRYDGKRVTVRGCITTDGREYVALSDLERPCRNGGIVPIDAPALRSAQKFHAEVDKKVCGTFTGTFRASTALYDRVLEIEETANLKTSALK